MGRHGDRSSLTRIFHTAAGRSTELVEVSRPAPAARGSSIYSLPRAITRCARVLSCSGHDEFCGYAMQARPATCDCLQSCVKTHSLRPVDVMISEEGPLPTSK